MLEGPCLVLALTLGKEETRATSITVNSTTDGSDGDTSSIQEFKKEGDKP